MYVVSNRTQHELDTSFDTRVYIKNRIRYLNKLPMVMHSLMDINK